MLRISQGSFFTYCLFVPLLIAYHVSETFKISQEIKQVFYFLPLLGIVGILFNSYFSSAREPLKLNKNLLSVAALYVFVFSVSIFFSESELYYETLFRDIIITLLPLLFFAFDIDFSHKNMIVLLFTAVACYLIWIKFKVAFVLLNNILVSNYYFDVEYHFGTVASIFVLYFIYKKDYKFLVLAIVLLLYVNKRANLLGIVPALAVYYGFIKPFSIQNKPNALFVVLFLYYILFYILGINLPFFAKCFLELMDKGYMKIDYFLTGRMILIDNLQPEIYDRGVVHYLFGNGPGQSDYYLWKVIKSPIYDFMTKPFLVHNDFLKLHFDIGLTGVFLYFFVMYYLYCVSNMGVILFLNMVPLFLIDNTIIFSYNIIAACIAARVFDKPENVLNP